ncbi:unnamed protein product, partial [Oppiella nova]
MRLIAGRNLYAITPRFAPTSTPEQLAKAGQLKAEYPTVKVGLGTDIGAGTAFCQLQTLNEAYKVQQLQGDKLSAMESLYHATLGGAKALHLDEQLGNFNIVIFMADLCRAISKTHELDFMTVSSYGGSTTSSRDVRILKDLDGEIRGKDILVVEDIIDSGNTLSKVLEILSTRHPNSIELCTLVSKPSRREIDLDVKFLGFEVEDKFIVGYGLDYDQKYRHIPFIGEI